jgi:hypothetical protein
MSLSITCSFQLHDLVRRVMMLLKRRLMGSQETRERG